MPKNRALTASAAALTTLTLTLTVAACGSDSSDSSDNSPSSATSTAANGDVFNDADVTFATDMIPHHAQAIEMVTMTRGRTLDPEVQKLAEEIRDAQAPEVETMTDWLTSWDQEVPATSLDHVHAGHDMGDMSGMSDMPGMMTADEMKQLENASDADFQDLWLTLMVKHHQGAIDMARTEQENGRFPEAVKLADSIITSQQAEIDRIDALLSN